MKLGRSFAESFFIALLCFSVLFFGAVHLWASMFLCAGIFLIGFLRSEVIFQPSKTSAKLLILLALLMTVILLQSLMGSLIPYNSVTELLKVLTYFSAFLFIYGQHPDFQKKVMVALVVLGFFEILYSLSQVTFGWEHVLWKAKTAYEGCFTGTYLNRNHFAGFLELCSGILSGFFFEAFQKKDSKKAILWGSLLFLFLLSLMKTGSRMGILSFFTALTLFSVVKLSHSKKNRMILLVCLVLAAGAFFVNRDVFLNRWDEVGERSAAGRAMVWKDSLAILKDYPLRGIGLGNYEWVFPKYQGLESFTNWNHPHNDYLELALSLGLPCFLLLGAGFTMLYVKLLKTSNENNTNAALIWGNLIGVHALLLHGIADFNFAIPANALILVSIIAMTLSSFENLRPPILFKAGVTRLLSFLFIFLFLFSSHRAIAGIFLSAGDARGLKWDPWNPQMKYAAAVKSGNMEDWEKFLAQVPFHGKAWLQYASSRIAFEKSSADGLQAAEWQAISPLLKKAVAFDPGSAWISFHAAVLVLENAPALTDSEKELALRDIQRSVAVRYSIHAPEYLQPAFKVLWKRFRDFDLLLKITPENEISYFSLLQFMEANSIVQEKPAVYERYLALNREAYDRKCDEAQKLLETGQKKKAFLKFREAYWINKQEGRAKAGMLATDPAYQYEHES